LSARRAGVVAFVTVVAVSATFAGAPSRSRMAVKPPPACRDRGGGLVARAGSAAVLGILRGEVSCHRVDASCPGLVIEADFAVLDVEKGVRVVAPVLGIDVTMDVWA
jgi:hypothetical protein